MFAKVIFVPIVVVQTFNPVIQEGEKSKSLWAQGQFGLHSECQANQSYIVRHYPKNETDFCGFVHTKRKLRYNINFRLIENGCVYCD